MTDPRVPEYAVLFRGRWACPCQVEWIPVYESELQRRGVLVGELGIAQLIGFFGGSGGTHAKGGANDFWMPRDPAEAVLVARQMGADATWVRPEGWDGADGVEHIHGVLTGCLHNGPAAYQIDAVRAGFNGLGSGGRGGADTGPRPLSGRTWREGIAWAIEQGDDMASPEVQRQLDAIQATVEQTLKEQRVARTAEAERDKKVRKALVTLSAMEADDATRAQVRKVIALLTEAPE